MLQTILLPLDDSALSRRALPYAEVLAWASGARLLVLQALPDPALRQHADERFAHLVDAAPDLAMESLVVDGAPAAAILGVAEERSPDVIVMATHSWSDVDRWLNGSVADEVLRAAKAPVLLVSAACERPWTRDRGLRVLVPLDGSTLAEAALPVARRVGQPLGAELVLLSAVPPPFETISDPLGDEARGYLAEVGARAWAGGLPVRTLVGRGAPAETIAAAAAEQDADLIAMATHGRGGLARVVLGSVSMEVLRRARVPVLLVRPATLWAAVPVRAAGLAPAT